MALQTIVLHVPGREGRENFATAPPCAKRLYEIAADRPFRFTAAINEPLPLGLGGKGVHMRCAATGRILAQVYQPRSPKFAAKLLKALRDLARTASQATVDSTP
jgi:hypothetical protein